MWSICWFSGIAFSGSKSTNMGSAVLEVGLSANIHKFCFQAAKRSEMDCDVLQFGLFADLRNGIFKSPIVKIIAKPSWKCVDLLIFTNTGLRVRNVEICASCVQQWGWYADAKNRVYRPRSDQKCAEYSLKGSDLLIHRIRVLRLGKVHICVVPPCYVVVLLIFRNRVFRLRNIQIWELMSWKVVALLIFTNSVFKLKRFRYGLCRTARWSICWL